MMENTAWLKQSSEPLFPDVVWSRPENKRYAGKLLIVGGHKQSFSAVSEAYNASIKAGSGATRVLLPSSLQKMLKNIFPEAEYAPANGIGSFSREALSEILDAAEWADAVLLAGDFGRNSETAVVLDSFIKKSVNKVTIAGDALDYFLTVPDTLTERGNVLVVASLGQLQKLAAPALIRQSDHLIKIVEQISGWADTTGLAIVTVHSGKIVTAAGGKISTTVSEVSVPDPHLAAYACVWWLQQPQRPFEALTSAIWSLTHKL